MEFHQGKPLDVAVYFSGWGGEDDIEGVFSKALRYAQDHYSVTLAYFRKVSLDDLAPHTFWSEYVWTVFASGFNAKVLTKNFNDIMTAIGPWDYPMTWAMIWKRMKPIFANERKVRAIATCRELMIRLGWDAFRDTHCLSVDTLRLLPFIGNITKFHLGRNIGIDAVKPDIHLVRLATHFQFDSPEAMCAYLSGFSGERIGVVDYILWAYAAAFGTLELR